MQIILTDDETESVASQKAFQAGVTLRDHQRATTPPLRPQKALAQAPTICFDNVAVPFWLQDLADQRLYQHLPAHPTVVKTMEHLFVELRCSHCGTNAIAKRGGGMMFLAGTRGLLRHLFIYGVETTFDEKLGHCTSRLLTEDMLRGLLAGEDKIKMVEGGVQAPRDQRKGNSTARKLFAQVEDAAGEKAETKKAQRIMQTKIERKKQNEMVRA